MAKNRATEVNRLREFHRRLSDIAIGHAGLRGTAQTVAKSRRIASRGALAATFAVVIFVGTLLLNTPWAQASGLWSWETVPGAAFTWQRFWLAVLNNLFTATSATCVTGLSVVNVSSYYSTFGKWVVAGCVQLGGIGLMTLGTAIVSALLGRASIGNETQVMQASGAQSIGSVRTLLWRTVRYVVGFETAGALILAWRYRMLTDFSLLHCFGYGFFHSVNGMCNAGLTLHSDNLATIGQDPIYMLTITALVTIGGIGFFVLSNMFHLKFWRRDLRRRGRLSLHAWLVLWSSAFIFLVGGTLWTLLEIGHSLGPSRLGDFIGALSSFQWGAAWESLLAMVYQWQTGVCQAAMARTAGFNFVNMGMIDSPANLLTILLMLIGGSPGSMAGGIKTTTVVVLLLTIRAYVKGNREVQIHHRTVSDSVCREAMVLCVFYIGIVFLFFFLLLLSEPMLVSQCGDFALFYEVASAFGTVGLSLNATGLLTPVGRILIVLAMFLGRIGPISVVMMMSDRAPIRRVRCPEEKVTVG